jgi:hypothetical protein
MNKRTLILPVVFVYAGFLSQSYSITNDPLYAKTPVCDMREEIPAQELKIREGHPILFLDQPLTLSIRLKTADLKAFRDQVHYQFEKNTTDPLDTIKIKG